MLKQLQAAILPFVLLSEADSSKQFELGLAALNAENFDLAARRRNGFASPLTGMACP